MPIKCRMLAKPGEEIFKRAKNKILESDEAALEHQDFNSLRTDPRIPLERIQEFLKNKGENSSIADASIPLKTNARIPPRKNVRIPPKLMQETTAQKYSYGSNVQLPIIGPRNLGGKALPAVL